MNRLAPALVVIASSTFMACDRPAVEQPARPAPIVNSGSQAASEPVSPPSPTAGSSGSVELRPFTIDLRASPNTQFRVDSFSVPDASRAEFVTTMQQNAAFLSKLQGFKGHLVFEKTSGPTTFNIVTLAAWDSPEAMKSAGEKVRADYQRTGFDMQGTMARWGVTASIGGYSAPMALQGAAPTGAEPQPFTIDLQANPNLQFRVDAFSVPANSRLEFETTMHENAAFLAKLPGFKGHAVFEKTSGPTTFNIVTLAAWESPEAMKSAGEKVRADYQRTGFDMQGTMARWGVTASIGGYRAPLGLQQ